MEGSPVKKNSVKGILMLLLTSLIWGTGFIAQSVGMESIEAFTFNGIRNLLGAIALLPVIAVRLVLLKKRKNLLKNIQTVSYLLNLKILPILKPTMRLLVQRSGMILMVRLTSWLVELVQAVRYQVQENI